MSQRRGSLDSALGELLMEVNPPEVVVEDELLGETFEFDDGRNDECVPLMPLVTPIIGDPRDSTVALGRWYFVDTDVFQVAVAVVVLANLVVASFQAGSEEDCIHCRIACSGFLAIYCWELALRVMHFGLWSFLSGRKARYWNWCDVLVVILGVAHTAASFLDFRRLSSTLGICSMCFLALKLVRVLMEVSFAWTEAVWFQWTVGGVIMFNALVMGLETDYPSSLWRWVDQFMLLFFIFELVVRMKLQGFKMFWLDEEERTWNIIDFSIVVFGAFDLWGEQICMVLSGQRKSTGFGRLMMLARMLRLLRILRLLKLVKAVRPLYSLAVGVTQAMQSIFWVLVLTLVTLYAFSILATRMIGHSLLVDDPDEIPEETRLMFASIWDSMFTLFGVMNSQHFEDIEPLLTLMPCTKPVFVLFTVCSSWALLSVMTGVVSDHMMSVRKSQAQKDEQAQEDRRRMLQRSLRGIFAAADKDGSGTLERDEYLELLRSPFHKERIQEISRMPVQDLAMMFEWLDVNGNGEIDFKEFLHGFDWLSEPICGKSILKIGHAARSHCETLKESMEQLGKNVSQLEQQQESAREELVGHLREAVEAKHRLREVEQRYLQAEEELAEAQEELSNATAEANGGSAARQGKAKAAGGLLNIHKAPNPLQR